VERYSSDTSLSPFPTSWPMSPRSSINVWKDGLVVVDGHTRRLGALACGLTEVPVCFHDFATEEDALRYAIHNQKHRRNLTSADLMRCIEAVDKRHSPLRGQRGVCFKQGGRLVIPR
jgi:hypothetical protein